MILMLGDEGLKDHVTRALRWDTRVDEAGIGVSVRDRVVTLTGTVASYAEKLAAREAALGVPGVLDVANEIEVAVPQRLALADAAIAAAVRQALQCDVRVPDQRIQSTVSDGCVTLTGAVDLPREREEAARAVRHLAGVRGVRNDLVVSAPASDPEPIRRAIERALARHAIREGRHIAVTVADGIATLTGQVDTWAEKDAVLQRVSHTRGIRAIDDRLSVTPS